jgi:hypothetical protein
MPETTLWMSEEASMIAKLTNPVFISWYLAGVFLLGMAASSAITVAPEAIGFAGLSMLVCLACAFVLSGLALWLRHRARRGLGFGILDLQPVRLAYAVLALLITLVVFVMGVG